MAQSRACAEWLIKEKFTKGWAVFEESTRSWEVGRDIATPRLEGARRGRRSQDPEGGAACREGCLPGIVVPGQQIQPERPHGKEAKWKIPKLILGSIQPWNSLPADWATKKPEGRGVQGCGTCKVASRSWADGQVWRESGGGNRINKAQLKCYILQQKIKLDWRSLEVSWGGSITTFYSLCSPF